GGVWAVATAPLSVGAARHVPRGRRRTRREPAAHLGRAPQGTPAVVYLAELRGEQGAPGPAGPRAARVAVRLAVREDSGRKLVAARARRHGGRPPPGSDGLAGRLRRGASRAAHRVDPRGARRRGRGTRVADTVESAGLRRGGLP